VDKKDASPVGSEHENSVANKNPGNHASDDDMISHQSEDEETFRYNIKTAKGVVGNKGGN
jgi:hypothetical protein